MNATMLIDLLRAGKHVFGTLIVSPSPRWPDVVKGLGLDFIFIDTEHIALDRAELSWMCQTYSALGLPPLVRIPSPDPYAATMVLDGGASGVIAPYVESVEQVRALRGAVKLRPLKGQRIQRIIDGEQPEPELAAYMEDQASKRALIVNIESVPAMEALDSILIEPGLDAVLIGPHDLSCSLGIPEQWDHPRFLTACENIFRKARVAKIGAGIHFWGDAVQQARFISQGANMLIHSADISLFQKHLLLELAEIRAKAGIAIADSRTSTTLI